MLQDNQQLNDNTLTPENLEENPTRNGFGKGLLELGGKNDNVVALCADLASSTRMHWFRDEYPDRYIELGVAEQNLATVGSGLANYGKVPFIASYAAFSPGRNNEQIRTTISLNNVPVKIAGCHAGVSVGPDGATHQALEDIALMRAQPHMTVLVPADEEEARKATIAAADHEGPVYIRLSRAKFPVFTTENTPFEIGKAQLVYDSSEDDDPDVGIIACGSLVHESLMAAEELKKDGITVQVLNLSTIKPLDTEAIDTLANKVKGIVTVEEHQKYGGMGSAVSEYLAENNPTQMRLVGVDDQFGQSGQPKELLTHYELDKDAIQKRAKELIN